MSYTTYEKSDYSGHPLELYKFVQGDNSWLYTSADHEISWGDDTYSPVYISRNGFTKVGDARKSTLSIEMAAQNDVALLFRTGWLTETLLITIYRHHANDDEYSMLWKGRVTACKWAGSTATLTSDSASTLFKRSGLRRVYQTGCPHVLFSSACGLTSTDWQVSATVSAVDSTEITVTGIDDYGDGYFLGGMIQSGDDLRLITVHASGVITMIDTISDIAEGDTITLWPGCLRTVNACTNKFDNLDNYGGLPYLPDDDPFSGDALV